jgi:hypothetical protein
MDNQQVPVAAGFEEDDIGPGNTPSPFMHFSTNQSANPLYQNVTSPITFSVYFFRTDSDSAVLLDNIEVDGTTTPVPEPAGIMLLLAGCILLGAARLRTTRLGARPRR